MKKIIETTAAILGTLALIPLALLVGLLIAFPVMWCWNFVMPFLFGLKVITWFQAYVLWVLTHFLIRAR